MPYQWSFYATIQVPDIETSMSDREHLEHSESYITALGWKCPLPDEVSDILRT